MEKKEKPITVTFKENPIIKFRDAIAEFSVIKLGYRIKRGDYDRAFKSFLSADSKDACEFTFTIQLLPNDILFMRLLLGEKITPDILSKLKAIWDQEK